MEPTYHVLFCTDGRHSEGLFALINSIVRNTATPERFFFHVLVDEHPEIYAQILQANFSALRFEVVSFASTPGYARNIEFLTKNICVRMNRKKTTRRIGRPMNFTRLYLPEIFSDVDLGLYLDVDMIAQADLKRLFDVDLQSATVASPINRFLTRYHPDLKLNRMGFNAGLLLIDFRRWRESNIIAEIECLMQRHKEQGLFPGGTQPLLNTVFHGKCLDLDPLWNVTCLGRRTDLEDEFLAAARILHWTGTHKPWLETGLYKNYWERYRLDLAGTGLIATGSG